MTLIAAIQFEKFPILFGDLLITGPTQVTKKVEIPTNNNVQDFFGGYWAILGLSQKINVVSDNLAIAWSGKRLYAQMAIIELKKRSIEKDLTLVEVLDYLNNMPELLDKETSFIGLIHDDNITKIFQVNAQVAESSSLGKLFLDGSGIKAIEQFSDMLDFLGYIREGEPNGVAIGIAHALTLGGFLINTELREGNNAPTLLEMFGGGYEFAFVVDGHVQKLENITFIFWDVVVDTSNEPLVSCPKFILKQINVNNHLLIRSGALMLTSVIASENLDYDMQLIEGQTHDVPPLFDMYTKVSQKELDSIQFESEIICHCIVIKEIKKPDWVSSLVDSRKKRQNRIEHGRDKDNLLFKSCDITMDLISSFVKKSID